MRFHIIPVRANCTMRRGLALALSINPRLGDQQHWKVPFRDGGQGNERGYTIWTTWALAKMATGIRLAYGCEHVLIHICPPTFLLLRLPA